MRARAAPQVDAAVYERAAQFLADNRSALVTNSSLTPHWRSGRKERFTFRRELGERRAAFVEVDAATGAQRPAFDAGVIAAGLSHASGAKVDPLRLPFQDYDEVAPASILFTAADRTTWTCSVRAPSCQRSDLPIAEPTAVRSPDGKWLAFLQGGNLWIRSADGSLRFPLTNDATPHYEYAVAADVTLGIRYTGADGRSQAVQDGHPLAGPPGPPSPPLVVWSPDSKRLFTHRLDQRNVAELTLVQSTPTDGTLRPVANSWRYAFPNDAAVPLADLWIFDVSTRRGHRVDVGPIPVLYLTSVEAKEAWWSDDSRRLYLLTRPRYFKSMTLYVIDSESGQSRELISESGKTFVEACNLGERPMIYVLRSGDVVWFSERNGYGHLYLYDGTTGSLKRRLTSGAWTVRNVLWVDEAHGMIYVAANERIPTDDPYYRRVYAVELASGRMKLLTPEVADHDVASAQVSADSDRPTPLARTPDLARGFSPSGRYFLDTYRRVDAPPVTVLRRSDGQLVSNVQSADVTRLKALGFVAPERFSAVAADGKTVLYGNILRPSKFDVARKYPVIDNPYPGPQRRRAATDFVETVFDIGMSQAVAELGFIVIALDGRGTHGRSKAFQDLSYGALGQAGNVADHVAVLRQLAQRYPSMDLDRVGIYGTSAGGYAAVHSMLTYPDFFKVGVADAGNHDQRSMYAIWGELFNGPELGANYTDAANTLLAAQLQGKLLLLQGDMDSNVFPSQTLQLVDALIKANKDFDMLIVPNAGHGVLLQRGYGMRRAWDFLVRNLQNAEPPARFAFQAAPSPN